MDKANIKWGGDKITDGDVADMILSRRDTEIAKNMGAEIIQPIQDTTTKGSITMRLRMAKTMKEKEDILIEAGLAQDSRHAWEKPLDSFKGRGKVSIPWEEIVANSTVISNPSDSNKDPVRLARERVLEEKHQKRIEELKSAEVEEAKILAQKAQDNLDRVKNKGSYL